MPFQSGTFPASASASALAPVPAPALAAFLAVEAEAEAEEVSQAFRVPWKGSTTDATALFKERWENLFTKRKAEGGAGEGREGRRRREQSRQHE